MSTRRLNVILFAALIAVSAAGCGGGGGDSDSSSGGNFSGAASVSIRVQPAQIDSGDQAQVEVSVGDVHENGIALKFRYPEGLEYVSGSASLEVDEKDIDLTPDVNVVSTEDEATYLIFYLPQRLFRVMGDEYNGEPGTVRFEVAGRSAIRDGLIEVDPDVDDPQVDNSKEFDLSKPEFRAEDQASISVLVGR